MEGWENLTNAIAAGKGVLLFSAHIGNWEIGSLIISRAVKFNVIARALDNQLIEADAREVPAEAWAPRSSTNSRRRERSSRPSGTGRSWPSSSTRTSSAGKAVFVDFFGRPAGTTPALGAFHLRTGAPLLPVFCLPVARAATA